MFEHYTKPVLPWEKFLIRVFRYLIFSLALLAVSLGMGILGYHYVANLRWIDALLNASMILTGMGPVDAMTTDSAKVFASFYALFSGIAFVSTTAMLLAPVVHRFLHLFRIEEGKK